MDDCHDIAMLEVAALVFALATATLCVIAQRSRFLPRAVQWIREAPLVRGLLAILLLSIGPITARTKTGGNAPLGTGMRPPVASVLELTRPETASPPFVCSESRTNGVAMVEPTTNAVVSQSCLLHGACEQGEWIESDAPFFFHWKFPRQHGHPTKCFAGEIVSAGEDCTAMNQASGMRRAEGPSLHA